MTVIEETADPLSQFLYALKAPETKRQWPRRSRVVFDFLGLQGTIHEQAREFMALDSDGSVTLVQSRLMEFLSYQVQRSHRGATMINTILRRVSGRAGISVNILELKMGSLVATSIPLFCQGKKH
jgi:hypothetical protein